MRRILLAEDEEMTRRALVFSLTREGYLTQAHPDGQAAWDAFRQPDAAWDLLVTDLQMPRLDGLELSRQVRERHSRLPIVILTGQDEDLGPLPAEVHLIAKPYRLAALLELIRTLIG